MKTKRKKNPGRSLSRRQMLRCGLYGGLTGALSSALWLGGCTRLRRAKGPNIVFILIDALCADHLPSYGYKTNTTPNIQWLADQGVVFKRVIAPSSWTKTSMASIMTSCNPSRHGVRGVKDVLPDRMSTLAEGLTVNGYYTIGVNTNPWLKSTFGFNAGFDIYQTIPFTGNFASAWDVNRQALALLERPRREQSIFVYLHYMNVHAPYRPKPPFFSKRTLVIPGIGPVPDVQLEFLYRKKGLEAPGVQQRVIELYDGEILTADAAVHQLFRDLQKMSRFENTIFVITSDHGEAFREHGTTEHGWNLYPEVYEVPLIFFWPGHLPGGRQISAQIRSIDIAPTLFALAGLTLPDSFEGETLLPMQADAIQSRVALSAVGLNDYIPNLDYAAVISEKHLYVLEKTTNTVEFYDLESDADAKHNLGASHPEAAFYARLEESDTVGRAPKQTELDPQTRKQLESLGYLE